ncbi:hypothetical protein [Spirosoma aerophilum]
MSGFTSNASLLTPEVLLRLMLYTDQSRQTVTQFAPAAWINFDTAFGPDFQMGTEHRVSMVNENGKFTSYRVVVDKPPFLEHMPHPDKKEVYTPTLTLYLVPAA